MNPTVLFHVDIDSPRTLAAFWEVELDLADTDRFYRTAMARALDLFAETGVSASFFCVGREIDEVPEAARWIRRAFDLGHEIANHTYTHPYGFSRLSRAQIVSEVTRCQEAVTRVIGRAPSGFRCPSYDLGDTVLDVLEELRFAYDSSAYWSSLMPLMKWHHRFFSGKKSAGEFGHGSSKIGLLPYHPSKQDWRVAGSGAQKRRLLEIPLTRSSTFQLPFYNNFHLMAGSWYRDASVSLMHRPLVVYLIHLIEFVGLDDGVPSELSMHPNLTKSVPKKIDFLKKTIRGLKKHYDPDRADRFADRVGRS